MANTRPLAGVLSVTTLRSMADIHWVQARQVDDHDSPPTAGATAMKAYA